MSSVFVPMTGKRQVIIDNLTAPNVKYLFGYPVTDEVAKDATDDAITNTAYSYICDNFVDESRYDVYDVEVFGAYEIDSEVVGWEVDYMVSERYVPFIDDADEFWG